MSRTSRGAGARRIRASLIVATLTAAVVAGSLVAGGGGAQAAPATPTPSPSPTATATATAAPRPVGAALAVDVTGSAALTLPAGDGLRDATKVRIRSGEGGAVDLIATRGKKSVHLADAVRLAKAGASWQRTVRVTIPQLSAGTWSLRARRSDDRAVAAKAPTPLTVGSGKPVHVAIRPVARTLYPWQDGVLDRADVTVVATDETGTAVPVQGSVRIDAAKRHVAKPVGATGLARLSVVGLPLGTAAVTAKVTGPAGKAVTRRSTLVLAPTGVGSITLTRSSDTLQPVKDGFLDTETLTVGGAASAGSPAKVSGTLTISLGKQVVAQWAVPDGSPRAVSWDGRTLGAIVPGSYTATLTLRGPEGLPTARSRTILVTKDHLPYTVQDLFSAAAGNQQGLAVHDGTFYVGYDNGDGTSRIETFGSNGQPIATLGPIAIGHAAELAFSTVSGLLYAANGGAANPTQVWAIKPDWDAATLADPGSAIVESIDLSSLGNNGMIAVDDAHSQLLVFSGTAPSYTVTAVSLWPASDGSGHLIGTPMPIAITGVPQGIEIVDGQLWVYTSLKGRNHLEKYDLAGTTLTSTGLSADLMMSGEGEGSATGTWNNQPAFFIGAHDSNRVGMLVPVADE
ncbi:hypothetical protein [uncultured Amnibacterium sp.]|uniref:hypothetical protein n=1 Tax=uncultured Amnibacterium sp. TaxID=1631851 RepID=UPI0035CAAE65